jgi:hypothetical protein
MKQNETQTRPSEEQLKRSYDACLLSGFFPIWYPNLSGEWEEDKDFWYEEYLNQLERYENEG